MIRSKILSLLALIVLMTSAAGICNNRETPVVQVLKENADAVVNISTEKIIYLRERPFWGSYDSDFDMFFNQFYGNTYALKFKSVGSGVVIDRDGIIVTNAHVVDMASNIVVIFNDGYQIEGKVVYKNQADDISLIKINTDKAVKSITTGKTNDIMMGETAIAIGNPLGLENSVTVGVISGKNREFYASQGHKILTGLLQTDAPINPGNSGGALLNLDGELIGINVAVVQNSQSIGFAIPVEKVNDALKKYKRNKEVSISKRRTPDSGKSSKNKEEDKEPYSDFDRMSNWINQMMRDSFGQWDDKSGMFDSGFSYRSDFDIEETDKDYTIKLEIENLDKQKINVEINNNSLSVSGQREEETSNLSSYTKSYGSFYKMIPLPEDADIETLKTETDADILIIKLNKME